MTRRIGKPTANRPIGNGQDEREHGTRYKTGVKGVLNPDMVRKLASQGMGLSEIGYYYGCTKSNICHAIKSDEDLSQAWNEGLSMAVEKATGCLMRNIENDNVLAAMFLLKCKHLIGEKGWLEQQYKEKIVDPDLAPRVMIYLPENNRDVVETDNDPTFLVESGSHS